MKRASNVSDSIGQHAGLHRNAAELDPDLIVVVSSADSERAVLGLPKFCCLSHASICEIPRSLSDHLRSFSTGRKRPASRYGYGRGTGYGAVFEIHRHTLPQGITTDLLERQLPNSRHRNCRLYGRCGTASGFDPPESCGGHGVAQDQKSDGA